MLNYDRIYITIGNDDPKSPVLYKPYINIFEPGSEIYETIQRIKDYMKSIGFVLQHAKIPEEDANYYQCGYGKIPCTHKINKI